MSHGTAWLQYLNIWEEFGWCSKCRKSKPQSSLWVQERYCFWNLRRSAFNFPRNVFEGRLIPSSLSQRIQSETNLFWFIQSGWNTSMLIVVHCQEHGDVVGIEVLIFILKTKFKQRQILRGGVQWVNLKQSTDHVGFCVTYGVTDSSWGPRIRQPSKSIWKNWRTFWNCYFSTVFLNLYLKLCE